MPSVEFHLDWRNEPNRGSAIDDTLQLERGRCAGREATRWLASER